MSQHSFSIANEAGAAFRSDVNSALQALASCSRGAAAPATTYAGQVWDDSTANVQKKRNAANSAWIVKMTIDETFVLSRSSNTILGLSDIGKTIIASSSFSQTLTAAATLGDGWWVNYRNDGTQIITLDPNSTEQIDGATTIQLYPGEGCTIVCNGSSFKTIGRHATGSFTATLTGVTASVTGTAYYTIDGNRVTIDWPSLTGTSNTTACTVTGAPSAVFPATNKSDVAFTQDNSASPVASRVDFTTGGVLTLYNAQSLTFTGSNVKGLAVAKSITFTLN